MKGFRASRLAEQLRREVSAILNGEARDPSLAELTVTRVEVTPDLKLATIFVVGDSGREDSARLLKSLKQAQGFVRRSVAKRLDLRRAPEVEFRLDRGAANANRIETLLGRINKRARRSNPALLIMAALTAIWGASATASPPAETPEPVKLERYEASATAMGTTFTVAAYGEKKGFLASAILAAFDEARRIDSLISNYDPDSEWSRMNREASRGAFELSAETANLLARCLEYSRLSQGAFDVSVGPLMRVWGFFRGSGELPGRLAISRALARVGYRHIEFDPSTRKIRFLKAGMELDPGGIGKGYAVDRIAALLRRAGVKRALISAGTSSIYGLGSPPQEPRGWKVRISRPDDPDADAAVVYLNDESLSTSGSREKFFEAEGRLYSHIMDPRTGMPAQQGVASVSVPAPNTIDSEAWTTALFVNGRAWGRKHLPAGMRAFFCLSDGSCSWVEAELN